MAEGGSVRFCDDARAHEKGCQYFADGGEPQPIATEDTPSATQAEPMPQPNPMPTGDEGSDFPTMENTTPVEDDFPTMENTQPVPGEEDFPTMFNTVPVEQYETPDQTVLSALEGAGKGAFGPIPGVVETAISKLGLPLFSPESQAAREVANPVLETTAAGTALVGSTILSAGLIPAAVHGAEAVAALTKLGTMGQKFLASAIANGGLQATDELGQILMGTGNPADGAAARICRVGAAALLGVGSTAVAKTIQKTKIGSKLIGFAAGLGANSPEAQAALEKSIPDLANSRAVKLGQKAYKLLTSPVVTAGIIGKDVYDDFQEHGLAHALSHLALDATLGFGAHSGIKKFAPAIVKTLTTARFDSNLGQIAIDALDHAADIGRGMADVNKGIDNLARGISMKALNTDISHKQIKKVQDFISNNTLSHQIKDEVNAPVPVPGYAKGGEVKTPEPTGGLAEHTNGAATVYPEQHVITMASKGRVVNYLNSLRPDELKPKLAFDKKHEDPRAQKRYDRATEIAVNPLSVLEKGAAGTLEREHLQDLSSMYPEVHDLLQKKLTERITKMQLADEIPPSHIRASMSLILGTPMSSEYTQANIQAAQQALQGVATARQAQQPAPGKPAKNSKAPLSKTAQSLQTTGQSLISRQQRDT